MPDDPFEAFAVLCYSSPGEKFAMGCDSCFEKHDAAKAWRQLKEEKEERRKGKTATFWLKIASPSRLGKANWAIIIEKVIIHSRAVDKANLYLRLPSHRLNILIVGSPSRDFHLILFGLS